MKIELTEAEALVLSDWLHRNCKKKNCSKISQSSMLCGTLIANLRKSWSSR